MRLPTPSDTTKLRAAIKHVVSLCSPDELGMVKLHKTLYYADMVHFATRGEAITGAEYRKREHGPTCDLALTALRQLSEAHEIEVKRVDYFGYWKKEFNLLASPETNELSAEEKGLLADCVEWVCKNNTAKGISEISHNGPWERVEYGEVIPYFTAFSLFPTDVSEETMTWARHASESIDFADKASLDGKGHTALLSGL
jgi:hypothetical protein